MILEETINPQTIQYFNRINKILPERYPNLDFTDTTYKNSKTKITVVCKLHGKFEILVTDLMRKRTITGCRKCGTVQANQQNTMSKEEFIERANKVHANKYDYSNVEYINISTKITVNCPIHGNWEVTPYHHLEGSKCPKCAKELSSKACVKPFDVLKVKATNKHNGKYKYDESTYINATTPMIIICPIHGKFEKSMHKHLDSTRPGGCPQCTTSGFSYVKPAIVYYLKVSKNDNIAYKIGITNRSIHRRYSNNDLVNIEILWEKQFEKGIDAYNFEQTVIITNLSNKYIGPPLLENGNTELFKIDILNKDNKCQME